MTLRSNADELALIAQEVGAQVIRGPVKYPGREGGFDVGDTDLEEILYELKDQEVVLIIAPVGPAEELPTICGLCGTEYEGDECPVCKAEHESAKRVIEERLRQYRAENDRIVEDVEDWLEERGSDPTPRGKPPKEQ